MLAADMKNAENQTLSLMNESFANVIDKKWGHVYFLCAKIFGREQTSTVHMWEATREYLVF